MPSSVVSAHGLRNGFSELRRGAAAPHDARQSAAQGYSAQDITVIDEPIWRWVVAFVLCLLASGAINAVRAEDRVISSAANSGAVNSGATDRGPADIAAVGGTTTGVNPTTEVTTTSAGPTTGTGPSSGAVTAIERKAENDADIQLQVVQDPHGKVVKRSVRADAGANANDPVFTEVFASAKEYSRTYRSMQRQQGLQAAQKRGIELREQIASLCNVQLEITETKDDALKGRCAEVRQDVDRALGELRDE